MKRIFLALLFMSCFAALASASPAVFIESNNAAAPNSEVYPTIELHEDGSFMFRANLYEGIGIVHGTYKLVGNEYRFIVTNRDFSGFTGDDVEEFVMKINGDTLIYSSDSSDSGIGATIKGSVFYGANFDGDAISELSEQLYNRFPNLEAIKVHFGKQAKWQKNNVQGIHGNELVLNNMEFSGIKIHTLGYAYEDGERFLITLIDVKKAGIVNFLGIDVGSARADVIKRFGEPSSNEGNKLIYENESGYIEIKFTIVNNKVTEMVFYVYPD